MTKRAAGLRASAPITQLGAQFGLMLTKITQCALLGSACDLVLEQPPRMANAHYGVIKMSRLAGNPPMAVAAFTAW